MSTVEQIEEAVASLTEEDYGRFRSWFVERDWQRWDRQIERDSRAGRLDFLVEEALQAKKTGRLRGL